MTDTPKPEIKFEGEDANAGFASPTLDLIASLVLIAISVAMMVASWRLPMPGEIHTAPGLLPFLVAASLIIMALGLGASALARRRAGARMKALADRDIATDVRSMVLAIAVALYIGTLQVMAFQQGFNFLGTHIKLTAFEPATILALSTFIHLSWRGPLWITVSVSVTWTVILSLVFQLVFRIPLPGSF